MIIKNICKEKNDKFIFVTTVIFYLFQNDDSFLSIKLSKISVLCKSRYSELLTQNFVAVVSLLKNSFLFEEILLNSFKFIKLKKTEKLRIF